MSCVANIGLLVTKKELIEHGCQPLHSTINVFNFILHLAYKKGLLTWRVPKEKLKTKKLEILKNLERAFAIKFDRPKSGGPGNTTTGKLCRRAFKKPDLLAKELNIEAEIVKNLRILLVLLNSLERIRIEKYGQLCLETQKLIIQKHPKCKISPTVHRVLCHSKYVIENLPLPPGYFSEEGPEARNKFTREYFITHARKSSRIATLEDVFTRSLDSSDPLLSSKELDNRMKHRKKKSLPLEMQEYVITNETSSNQEQNLLSTDDSDTDEDIDHYCFEADFGDDD